MVELGLPGGSCRPGRMKVQTEEVAPVRGGTGKNFPVTLSCSPADGQPAENIQGDPVWGREEWEQVGKPGGWMEIDTL